jgi:hypothetical protein
MTTANTIGMTTAAGTIEPNAPVTTAPARSAEVAPTKADDSASSKALTTRYLDFWLLGGASIAVWAVMFCLQPVRKISWAVDHHYADAFAISNSIALLVNYPHFMASYAFAYRKGWRFVRANWFQLLAVPLILVIVLSWSYFLFDRPLNALPWIAASNDLFAKIGLKTRIGLTSNVGTEVLALAVGTMYLTVGWHYTKQTYGCMMVYAKFDRFPLTLTQRRLVKWNLFGIWWMSFTYYNSSTDSSDFYGLRHFRLGLPHALFEASAVFSAVMLVVVFFWVFLPIYEKHGRWPSANMMVPFVAMYLWWVPMFVQNEFYLYIVPIFHSLQYLAFVYKVENTRLREGRPNALAFKSTVVIAGLVVAGFACFELIPNSADAVLRTHEKLHLWHVYICAQVFINIHHYFIDNVLWRFKNRDVQQYLLA